MRVDPGIDGMQESLTSDVLQSSVERALELRIRYHPDVDEEVNCSLCFSILCLVVPRVAFLKGSVVAIVARWRLVDLITIHGMAILCVVFRA